MQAKCAKILGNSSKSKEVLETSPPRIGKKGGRNPLASYNLNPKGGRELCLEVVGTYVFRRRRQAGRGSCVAASVRSDICIGIYWHLLSHHHTFKERARCALSGYQFGSRGNFIGG